MSQQMKVTRPPGRDPAWWPCAESTAAHTAQAVSFVDQLTLRRKTVTVLHEGSVLAEGLLADVQANEKVVEVYLGR